MLEGEAFFSFTSPTGTEVAENDRLDAPEENVRVTGAEVEAEEGGDDGESDEKEGDIELDFFDTGGTKLSDVGLKNVVDEREGENNDPGVDNEGSKRDEERGGGCAEHGDDCEINCAGGDPTLGDKGDKGDPSW